MSDFLLHLQIMSRACKFYGKTGLACWSPSIKEAFTKEKSAITVSFLPTLWTQEIMYVQKMYIWSLKCQKTCATALGNIFFRSSRPEVFC